MTVFGEDVGVIIGGTVSFGVDDAVLLRKTVELGISVGMLVSRSPLVIDCDTVPAQAVSDGIINNNKLVTTNRPLCQISIHLTMLIASSNPWAHS